MNGPRLRPVAIEATLSVTLFVLVPIGLVELNEVCGWPRWQSGIGRIVGGGLVLAAVAVALYCWSVLLSRAGRGTPVPTDPPERLVITGLYRHSRNPMYVAHAAYFFGLFLYRGELCLLVYAALYAVAIHMWIVWGEEPELRERFGTEYDRYAQTVPRWLWTRPR